VQALADVTAILLGGQAVQVSPPGGHVVMVIALLVAVAGLLHGSLLVITKVITSPMARVLLV
jgi:hypothetical protein